jgi:hypothetical protein
MKLVKGGRRPFFLAVMLVLVAWMVVAAIARASKSLRGLRGNAWKRTDTTDASRRVDDDGASKRKSDLSDARFLVETLKTLEAKDGDPNIEKALLFISECQNLKSSHSPTRPIAKGIDGGL